MPIENIIDDADNVLLSRYMTNHTGFVRIHAQEGSRVEQGDALYSICRLGIIRRVDASTYGKVCACAKDLDEKFVGYGTWVATIMHPLDEHERRLLEEEKAYNVIKAEYDANYFLTPSPSEPPLVRVDDVIRHGQMIAAAMVMKKRQDVMYMGNMPAQVKKIYFANGQVVKDGEPLFALAPI